MNKTYIAVFAVLISIVAGFFASSVYFKTQDEETSTQIVEFVQETMDNFLSSHDANYFRQHCTEEYNALLKDSHLAQYFKLLDYLGSYEKILAVRSDSDSQFSDTSSSKEGYFLVVETQFQVDTANILLELVREEERWKINKFSVQARVLNI